MIICIWKKSHSGRRVSRLAWELEAKFILNIIVEDNAQFLLNITMFDMR